MQLAKPLDVVYLPPKNSLGCFGAVRKNHIHEGVDLYTYEGASVYSMEDSYVVSFGSFTGPEVGSPWWLSTSFIMLEGYSGVINYGEISLEKEITKDCFIKKGTKIGHVKRVLRKDKGKPLSMLHLELYKHGTLTPVKEWKLNTKQPSSLLDPTVILMNCDMSYE